MASSRATKLRKLDDFRRRLPHATASALSAILDDVAEGGVPEVHSRKAFGQAVVQELARHDAYGPLISTCDAITVKGELRSVKLANPLSLLAAAYGQGGSFHELFRNTVAAKAGNALEIIIYFDEIVPGDPMGPANRRKIWTCYFSFKEFGARVLSNERAWIPCLEVRTAITATLSAGISQLCKHILHSIFLNPLGDTIDLGILLKGPTECDRPRVRFSLGFILQDGAAHKFIFCLRGDNGSRFCTLCKNCFAIATDDVEDDSDDEADPVHVVRSSHVYESECQFADRNDINGTLNRLKSRYQQVQDKHMTKGTFEKWQQAAGFNHEPHGLVYDDMLMNRVVDPTRHYVHDWMHCLFVAGVFNKVLILLLGSLAVGFNKSLSFLYKQLFEYIGFWVLPRDKPGDLQNCFTAKRLESNKKSKSKVFKCQASDGLGLYTLIGLWVMTFVIPAGVCIAEASAFLAMCDMIDVFVSCSQEGHRTTPATLSAAIDKFLKKCVAAGWKPHMTPKFHWLIHFPKHLRIHGFLVSCWVHERLHKLSKRYGADIMNTIKYEESLLHQVLCHVLADWRKPGLFDVGVGLKKPYKATKKALTFLSSHLGYDLNADNCMLGNEARVQHGSCARKDVVLISNKSDNVVECGEVWLHAQCNGQCVSLVSFWEKVCHDKPKSLMTWRKLDNPFLIHTSDILSAVVHKHLSNDKVATVVPAQLKLHA